MNNTHDNKDEFIDAYYSFKDSVDFTRDGFLPEVDNLVWYMLMGVPGVPADDDPSEDAPLVAIDQRVAILKTVFVEVNRDRPEDFLDKGLSIYDQAGKMAKGLLKESDQSPCSRKIYFDQGQENG